jgi:uncharacterized membrane protein YidH (DUF202 family)
MEGSIQTYLASERTLLAWVRTGIAATAVSLGIGRVVPEVSHVGHEWPYITVGVGYAVLGTACVVYGLHRQRMLDHAVGEGGYAEPSRAAMAALAALGVLLAVATGALVLMAP